MGGAQVCLQDSICQGGGINIVTHSLALQQQKTKNIFSSSVNQGDDDDDDCNFFTVEESQNHAVA